jgi:hypothetical protein
VIVTGAAGLLVLWYYVATVPFAATTDWSALGSEEGVAHHARWLEAALAWIREGRELAGAAPESVHAAPTAEEFEQAMRATAPSFAPTGTASPRWRLP